MKRNGMSGAWVIVPLLLVGQAALAEDRGFGIQSVESERTEAMARQADRDSIRGRRDDAISDIMHRLLPSNAGSIDRYQFEVMLSRASDATLADLGRAWNFEQAREMLLDGRGSSASRAVGDADQDFVYTAVTPCRIADTRPSAGGQGILGTNQTADFYVWGDGVTIGGQGGSSAGCPSPRGEPRAVHINATVVPTGGGFLTVYPSDVATVPLTSLVNYQPDNAPIANAAIIQTNYDLSVEELRVYTSKTTHVILDVLGYYYDADELAITALPEANIEGSITACARNTATNEYIIAPTYESHVPFCFASKGVNDSRGVATNILWEGIPAGTYDFHICAWQNNFGGCGVANPQPYHTRGAGLTVIQINSAGNAVAYRSTGYDLENAAKIVKNLTSSSPQPAAEVQPITVSGSGNTTLTIATGDTVMITGRTLVAGCQQGTSDCDFPPPAP